jgi:molybdopterin-guanine dinucleotide biosynthesis protein A
MGFCIGQCSSAGAPGAARARKMVATMPLPTMRTMPIQPMGGILSAFDFNPNTAWLIVACDMPLIDENSFQTLINHRNKAKIATAFLNPETNAPDPLFTIYEPKAFRLLTKYVEAGNKSPKVFLQNNDTEVVKLSNFDFLKNVNTKEEFERIKFKA